MKAITISPLFLFFFFSYLSPVVTQTALFAPVFKDPVSLLYTVTISLQTPPQPTKLHLDLSSSFTWLDCSINYNSTTCQHIPCTSPLCTSFHSFACPNDTCSVYPENPITRQATLASAFLDCLALPTPSSPSQLHLIPGFLFSCSNTFLLTGLADQVTGLAAFGRSNLSLPAQISNSLSSPRYFALCLPSSTENPGVALFGTSGPYYLSSPPVDVSKSLAYTGLILNPVGSTVISYNQQPSDEYYINLTSIQVNGKDVPLNISQLVINENGYGGTKLSTDTSYTILESSIYKAFVNAFVNESSGFNLSVASAVKPFDVCYEARNMFSTRVGPGVPTVDLVMEKDDVFWRIFGGNSMVRIERDGIDVWCLGFVDGGINLRTPIVIGGHQMEDNLLHFDLNSNRFGFSSTLLLQGTTCANFNST
ncbi:probable aspartic proteinase GIP1 [Euphorbia lathyris]|uniref:probable aspartic proteinase GIP1 n=1 Tax=Euphorbia lathyris TaxID=212925 RepID=UPI003313CA29